MQIKHFGEIYNIIIERFDMLHAYGGAFSVTVSNTAQKVSTICASYVIEDTIIHLKSILST